MEIKEYKIKFAQVEQAQKNDKKDEYYYLVHEQIWNQETKRFAGWKHITITSKYPHFAGDVIYYQWKTYTNRYGQTYGRYEEVETKEQLPF